MSPLSRDAFITRTRHADTAAIDYAPRRCFHAVSRRCCYALAATPAIYHAAVDAAATRFADTLLPLFSPLRQRATTHTLPNKNAYCDRPNAYNTGTRHGTFTPC